VNVLGIHFWLHDSAAALFQDGRLVFAAEEERFSRVKQDARFPHLAIKAALEYAGARLQDMDAIAFGLNRPGSTHLHVIRSMMTGRLPFKPKLFVNQIIDGAADIYRYGGARPLRRHFGEPRSTPVFFIDHHAAHAWSTYAYSGFEESLVLIVDNRGAKQATTLYHARDGVLDRIKSINWPNSLGVFYAAFTDWLGFEPYSDEWKVMGLAAYGEPDRDLSQFIRITADGYSINARLLCSNWWGEPLLERALGPRRQPEIVIADEDRNIAASVQKATEDALFAIVRDGVRKTGCKRLCLAGGVALNSKASGRLLESGLVDEIFVQPAAADDGTAIGAALVAHQRLGKPVPRRRLTDVYLGPEFSEGEVAAAVGSYKLRAHRLANVEEETARLVASGAIVGWFQGRMEFGPRALGSRSILADPTRAEMKDRVNDSVKFRESWRPFAPSCLAESAQDYFEGAADAAFMTITFGVRPHQRARIPAVTHADNTARVQTVTRDSNPRYWRLIKEFEKRTGVPVILNTSFNLRGEPIVCTPKDALRTFYTSGLDFLVLGDLIIPKDQAWLPGLESTDGAAVLAPIGAST
jgi:carbamoyltransferase